jgi:hypothetical protein
MELQRTSLQEWIALRAAAVRGAFSTFDALVEKGIQEVSDPSAPTQIACPFHGADNRPSARYYPRSGNRHDYVRCFKCRENWDAIGLYAKFRGIRFMDALSELEKRFRIRIPRRPEGPEIVEPADRGSSYVSDQWSDVPRVLSILETKLSRIKGKCGMSDYVKFCRLIDAVTWDYDHSQKKSPEMISALHTAMERMNEVMVVSESQEGFEP